MSWQGYALSVAGCPYLFTSGPLTLRECASSGAGTALTSDEQTARPWWFYDASLMGIAEGFLDVDAIAWAETAKPLDGDLDMGAQTFRLHDARADGHDLVTWLATRFADDVTSSPLASSVSSSATTWTVGHGATFSVDSFVWCERECARVTAVSGNDLTVARAQLGTRAVAHAVDDAAGRHAPFVAHKIGQLPLEQETIGEQLVGGRLAQLDVLDRVAKRPVPQVVQQRGNRESLGRLRGHGGDEPVVVREVTGDPAYANSTLAR